jgi:hypothetical protein
MKTSRTAVLALGLCAALLSACNKKGHDVTPDAAQTSNMQSRDAGDENISLQFTSGTMNAGGISVQAENHKVLTSIMRPQVYQMYIPMVKTGIGVPLGTYRDLTTIMDLITTHDAPPLQLRGEFSMANDAGEVMTAPIEFTVNTPFNIRMNSGLIEVTDYTTLLNLLNLKMSNLTANMPMDMWRLAYNDNPKHIIVSETSNPEMYRLMFNNLMGMLHPSPGDPGVPQYEAAFMPAGERK